MSNEYNNEIRQMVAYSHMNRFGELDNVYAQATKADEYETKAKAFDESLEAIRANLKSVRSDYGRFTLNVLKKQRAVTTENVLEAMEILMVGLLEYHESGEQNAKK